MAAVSSGPASRNTAATSRSELGRRPPPGEAAGAVAQRKTADSSGATANARYGVRQVSVIATRPPATRGVAKKLKFPPTVCMPSAPPSLSLGKARESSAAAGAW